MTARRRLGALAFALAEDRRRLEDLERLAARLKADLATLQPVPPAHRNGAARLKTEPAAEMRRRKLAASVGRVEAEILAAQQAVAAAERELETARSALGRGPAPRRGPRAAAKR